MHLDRCLRKARTEEPSEENQVGFQSTDAEYWFMWVSCNSWNVIMGLMNAIGRVCCFCGHFIRGLTKRLSVFHRRYLPNNVGTHLQLHNYTEANRYK